MSPAARLLLAAPQAAHAINFNGIALGQTLTESTAVNLNLPEAQRAPTCKGSNDYSLSPDLLAAPTLTTSAITQTTATLRIPNHTGSSYISIHASQRHLLLGAEQHDGEHHQPEYRY